MRVFTETSEEVFSYIHHLGHSSVVYVDNSYLIKACFDNVKENIKALREFRFIINLEKSVITPKQKITFLGFELSSETMTLTLANKKICK